MDTFTGLLFDMDGTIIDSTNAIVKHWHAIGQELGIDPNIILATSHGRRSIDVLRLYDESKANWNYVKHIEGQIPERYGADAVTLPGSVDLLDALTRAQAPWTIVTSGTRPLVEGWLKVMNIARPEHMVTAEDVQHGKPDPACYQLGAFKLRHHREISTQPEESILVLEDSPAGIKSGKAAGFHVVGLTTTHSFEEVKDAGADWIVEDLRSIKFHGWDQNAGLINVEIVNALQK